MTKHMEAARLDALEKPDEDMLCPECNTPLGVLGVDKDDNGATWFTCHNEQCALCDYSFHAAGYELLPRRAAIRAEVYAEVEAAAFKVWTEQSCGGKVLEMFRAALAALCQKEGA